MVAKLEQVKPIIKTLRSTDSQLDNVEKIINAAQLQQKNRQFQTLLESINDVVWTATLEGEVLYINSAAKRVYGRPSADFINNPNLWCEVVHPNDRAEVEKGSQQLFQQEQVEQRYRIVRPDGEIRWLRDHKSVIFDSKGNPIQIGGIATDITEEMQAKAALRESEELHRFLLENISDAVFVTDEHGAFVYIGINAHVIFGYSVEEIQAFANVTKLLGDLPNSTNTQLTNIEHEITDKFGKKHCLLINIKRVSIKNGTLLYACHDITKRKQAEKLLRQERDKAQAYLDIAGVMFIALNSDQNVILINKKGCEILGYSEAEIIGQNWFDNFLPVRDKNEIKTVFVKLMRGEITPVEYYENLILTKSGEERIIAWHNSFVRNKSGKITSILSSGDDITERKQIEMELAKERASLAKKIEERTAELSQANKELARASRLKDEFLANMSHEIRTPLNAIIVFSELLLDNLHGRINEKQRESIEHIDKSGKHLLSLINDILDLSKIAAGQIKLNIEPIQIHTLCRDCLQFIRPAANKKRIILLKGDDGCVTTIQADERRLKQILINLLSNAVKFTPEGGKVRLEMTINEQDGVVQFCVVDTGIGIPENDMEQLFQPFVQIDGGLSRHQEGTGLGLILVYKLVELHGGSVKVESEIGKGSTFKVSLPFFQQRALYN